MLYLYENTKLSDTQWQAIARQATNSYWRVEVLHTECDIPDYDALAMMITMTEEVFIERSSSHMAAAIARAINACEKDKLRCREIELVRDGTKHDRENMVSVARNFRIETGWTPGEENESLVRLYRPKHWSRSLYNRFCLCCYCYYFPE